MAVVSSYLADQEKGKTMPVALVHNPVTGEAYYTTPVLDTRKEAWAYAAQFVMSHRNWAGSEGIIGNIRQSEERKEYSLYNTIDLRQNERLGRPVSIEIRD